MPKLLLVPEYRQTGDMTAWVLQTVAHFSFINRIIINALLSDLTRMWRWRLNLYFHFDANQETNLIYYNFVYNNTRSQNVNFFNSPGIYHFCLHLHRYHITQILAEIDLCIIVIYKNATNMKHIWDKHVTSYFSIYELYLFFYMFVVVVVYL